MAEIVQQKGYYSFGMEISQFSAGTGTSKNWYNGKELQDDFGLYWYDYGARFYDPMLGRWHTIDPKAEQMRRFSPYSYAFDNPMRFIDPDGMKPIILGGPALVEGMKTFFKGIVPYSDVNDAVVLGTTISRGSDAINIDGTKATGFDKAGAVIGAFIPAVGGKAVSRLLSKGADLLGLTKKADNVLNETIESVGNITSKETLTETDALNAGIEFVGKDAQEIGKSGSGVYRSATKNSDGTVNQFRMDNNSLKGNHPPNVSHVHYEVINESKKKPVVNNHVKIKEDE